MQPPGTPIVGGAFLTAYKRTGDAYYREAAIETAHALVKGQLESGGWDYRIEFDPKLRLGHAYRAAPANPEGRNVTTLDDNNTQSALRFLMRVDELLEFKDAAIHEAARYALESLLKAQYPNGAWPQRYAEFPDPAQYPVKKASYPESWPRTWPGEDYRGYYTFNDNTIADMVSTMFDAADIYQDARYREAAEKAGGFVLLAQMPEPQPAWAQQYNRDMHPVWARKFEPASVTGGESQGVIRTLIYLYRRTGEKKYLEPIPRALAYLRASLLPDGRMARFHELETNTPLYFTLDYQLTYSDADMPTHYSFIGTHRLDQIEAEYQAALKRKRPEARAKETTPRMGPALARRAQAAVDALDNRGAWVEGGRLKNFGADAGARVINCATFVENVNTLSAFIAASR